MRIPYLGLLALGGAQNQENRIIELEKQVIEQLEQELDQNSKHSFNPCPDGNFRCRDGTCIDGKAKCDGISDCPDESDEADCKPGQRVLHDTNNDRNQRVKRQSPFDDLGLSFTTMQSFFDFTTGDLSGDDYAFDDFAFGDQTTDGGFFFNVATTANPMFDGFATTQPIEFGALTTEAMFDVDFMTTGSMDFNMETTGGFDDFAFATTQPSFFEQATTEALFDMQVPTTESIMFPQETTQGFDFGGMTTQPSIGLATTDSPLVFETTQGVTEPFPDFQTTESLFGAPTTEPNFGNFLQTTPSFDFNAPETTQSFDSGLLITTAEAVDPILTTSEFQIATTNMPIGPLSTIPIDFGAEFTTTGMDEIGPDFGPDFPTTDVPITLEGLGAFPTTPMMFPEVTTEEISLELFTTAASPTTEFAEIELGIVTTALPTLAPIMPTTGFNLPDPITTAAPVGPELTYFICKSGAVREINQNYVCDGMNDCSDGSDEADCGFTEPATTQRPVTQTQPMIMQTTMPNIPTDTTGSFLNTLDVAGAQPPSLLPLTEDKQQFERFVDQFVKWRSTIFDKWLSVMKIYQQRSGFKAPEGQTCRQYGRTSCENMSLTCKQDLGGCQYCYCEISRNDDHRLVENEWKMDVQFWQDVLQNQWESVWEKFIEADDNWSDNL